MYLENDILTSLDKKFKAIEEKSQTMLSIPENYFLVVRLDGFHATKKYIKDSLENKEFRGKNYGSDFLRKILNNFDKNIFLEVRQNNVSAIKLYENTGFKLVNIRKDYYSDTHENALVMVYDK